MELHRSILAELRGLSDEAFLGRLQSAGILDTKGEFTERYRPGVEPQKGPEKRTTHDRG